MTDDQMRKTIEERLAGAADAQVNANGDLNTQGARAASELLKSIRTNIDDASGSETTACR